MCCYSNIKGTQMPASSPHDFCSSQHSKWPYLNQTSLSALQPHPLQSAQSSGIIHHPQSCLVWLLCSVLSNFVPTPSVISSLQPLLPRPCCVCVPGFTFSPPFLSGSDTTSAFQKPQRRL